MVNYSALPMVIYWHGIRFPYSVPKHKNSCYKKQMPKWQLFLQLKLQDGKHIITEELGDGRDGEGRILRTAGETDFSPKEI